MLLSNENPAYALFCVYIPFPGHLVLQKVSVLGTLGCEHRTQIMHLEGLFPDVFATGPFQKMFGLREKSL